MSVLHIVLHFDKISIHALRVEGDRELCDKAALVIISIHALRVEGDLTQTVWLSSPTHFYPRPPGGGRPADVLPSGSVS